MKKRHINILFLLIWSFSFAQQYTNITTKNGLPSNHVYRITQDKQGFIWIVTDKGIVKYNGSDFKKFSTKEGLPTNDIWDFRITDDNKFWYFSKATKLGYILKDSVYAFESDIKNDILYPVVIAQNKNKIQIISSNKHYTLKTNKWHAVTYLNKNSITEEPVLHSIVRNLIMKNEIDTLFIEDKQHKVIASLKLPNSISGAHHRTQINDSLFCWSNNKTYEILNLNTFKIVSKSYKNQIGIKNTNFVRVNSTNNQIQFSGASFVAILDKNYNLTKTVYLPKKLKSHFSLIDKNNNLWIATFTNGVYFLPSSKRNSIIQLNNEKVGKLQWINKNLIANVYNKGFYKYDSLTKKFKPYINETGFMYNANYIDSLKTAYYLTNKKVIQLKNAVQKNFNSHKYCLKSNELARKIIYYKKNLYSFNAMCFMKLDFNLNIKKEYAQNAVRDILVFNNKLLIATSNGLKTIKNDSLVNAFKTPILVNKPIIRISKIPSKELILCTDGFGAYTTDLKTIKLLEQSDYLSVQNAIIKNNEIWLATSNGVLQYKKMANSYKLIRKYTTNDGLVSNLINDVAIVKNDIITSSNEGVSIISKNISPTNSFINIYFDDIKYNNKKLNNNDCYAFEKNNHLSVKIASIDFTETSTLKYNYKLMPIHKNWTSTNSKQLNFNDLPPNSYKLIIKSKTAEYVLNFKITPLWYQRLITKILMTILGFIFLIGIVLGYKKREFNKQTKKLNAQKKLADFELHALRSQMNPHFVFNSLNAIQYFITKNEIDLSEKYLVKFARLIRMFFDFSRKKEITLQDEINLLKGYLEIEKMRFGKDFNFKFNVDEKLFLTKFKIPTMLLQPIVENAVNHGVFHNNGKGLIELSFVYINKNKYNIIIADDGVGVKKSKEIQQQSLKKHESKSTEILNDRIELLNQSKLWHINYQIIDKNGTTVRLSITKNEENKSNINR